jgi:Ser/Thr protein kinase RdoA (MazF antagonist)
MSASAQFDKSPGAGLSDFGALDPDTVINAVEAALGRRCSNLCRPLNSYINRVYEVGLAEGGFVIAKFYRPCRWSRDALQDELDFLSELHEAEVPVVPPLAGVDGTLLHRRAGIWFAIFPKKGGRPLDELTDADWPRIGRLIARLHAVGARHAPRDRIRLDPREATEDHLTYIIESGAVDARFVDAYDDLVRDLIDEIAPLFDGIEELRIHGDCHKGNILSRLDEGYHLLDFDDMAVGPAVQDIWLLLPDRLSRSRTEIELFLEGYETFLAFPRETLRLIEPLRAMRFIHYTAWCARQKADGGFVRLAPGWGNAAFWRQEIAEIEKQRQEIRDALERAP